MLEDIIMATVYEMGGLKPLKSGTYVEELMGLPYPYRNFKSGTSVDKVCRELSIRFNVEMSENELIEYVDKYYNKY